MMKTSSHWFSPRLGQKVHVVRYGHFGTPVLLFPTAGGDAEESERFQMMKALEHLITGGRIKVYSVDSVAGRTWIDQKSTGAERGAMQNRFDAFIYQEVVPAIRADCGSADIEIITAGASIGAFNALAAICRHPNVFSKAICMSGTYDLTRWMSGQHTFEFHVSSPLHFLPFLNDEAHLKLLRSRFILLGTGEGRWEAPGESWAVASVLGSRGIPNRVDLWGKDYDHDWVSWREKLPRYLEELA